MNSSHYATYMALSSKVNRNKLRLLLSARFWILIGTLLILTGFFLAHISNAHMIHWKAGSEKTAHVIFHVIGPIILLAGIVKLLLESIRKKGSTKP